MSSFFCKQKGRIPFCLQKKELKKSGFWRNISPTYQKASVTISDSYLCFWLISIFCISLNVLEDAKSPSRCLVLLFCLELTIKVVCKIFEKCSSPCSGSVAGWVHAKFVETINVLQTVPFPPSYTNYRLIHHQAFVAENSMFVFNGKSTGYAGPASRIKYCLFIYQMD